MVPIRSIATLTLALLSVVWIGAAAAAPFGGRHGPHLTEMFEREAEAIGLDDATLERLRAAVAASEAASERVRGQLHRERKALRELLSADRPDEAAVMQQAEVIGALETDLFKRHLAILLEIRALLGEEQVGRLRERRGARMAEALRACAAEIAEHCPDATHAWERLRCLRRHHDDLSGPCRAALRALRGGHERRR